LGVADVEPGARRVREHVEHVVLRLRAAVRGAERLVLVPPRLPARLDLGGMVGHYGDLCFSLRATSARIGSSTANWNRSAGGASSAKKMSPGIAATCVSSSRRNEASVGEIAPNRAE